MPVFEQSYPRWRPTAATRVRWWPIVRRELQMLLAQRAFQGLLVVTALPVLVHILQIYSVNKVLADPRSELARALRSVQLVIDAEFFFRFLRLQTFFVFTLLLYASSGLVCDDIRLNRIEVYFSKPLTVRDYLLGKLLTVAGLGLAFTALPALFLFVAQALMSPTGPGFLEQHARVPFAALGHALVIVLPITTCTLACSALTPSRGFAAAALVALLAVDGFSGTLMAELLDQRAANLIAVPSAMSRVGEALFGVRPDLPVGWAGALLVVTGVTAAGLAVLRARLRSIDLGGAG